MLRLPIFFLLTLLLAACATTPGGGDAAVRHAALVEALGGGADMPLALVGEVVAPDGGWRLEVLSVPGQGTRVSRHRDGATTVFTRSGSTLWRVDADGDAARLPGAYRFFLQLHELPRLVDRLADWPTPSVADATSVDGRECTTLIYRAGSESPVQVCVAADDGRPVLVTFEPPAAYGSETVHVLPHDWTRRDGRLYLTGYSLWHGPDSYEYRWSVPRAPGPGGSIPAPPDNLPPVNPGLSEALGDR